MTSPTSKGQSLRPQPSPSISRYDHLSALCRWCGIQWRIDSAHATMEHAILVAADHKDEIERLQADLAIEREQLADLTKRWGAVVDDRERLRAALTEAHELMWNLAESGLMMHGVEGLDPDYQPLCDWTEKYPRGHFGIETPGEHYDCPIHGRQDGPDCARC